MKGKFVNWYVRGIFTAKVAVCKTLGDKRGASTIEYVAVLAGAAALGAVILTAVGQAEGGLVQKIIDIINSVGGGGTEQTPTDDPTR